MVAMGTVAAVDLLAWAPESPPWTAPPPPPPPEEDMFRNADADLAPDAEDVLASLAGCRWLFPPGSVPGELGQTVPPSDAGGRGGSNGGEATYHFVHQYYFTHIRSEQARAVVNILLEPSAAARRPNESLATLMGRVLGVFVARAFEVLVASSQGRIMLPEGDRVGLVDEARCVMRTLVQKRHVSVVSDLVFCLEAFGVSRGRPEHEQHWLCERLVQTIHSVVDSAPQDHQAKWRRDMRDRISGESELYGLVDVRAWPFVLQLVGADVDALLGEALGTQVRMQLCLASNKVDLLDGLRQAATLVKDLRLQQKLGAEEVRTIFNDSGFDRRERRELLRSVLGSAPTTFTHDVLREMDDRDVDISERDDDELGLVRDLVVDLKVDVRRCPNLCFIMRRDWIAGHRCGVVNSEELSPDQLCDHIEDDPNYEDLLKTAVNKCLNLGRRFEAARMLARAAGRRSRVMETNRNNKQLQYIVSLYQEAEAPADRFGPVEEATLMLPVSFEEVLVVESSGRELQLLQNDLLMDERPRALGVWWFWRCLNPRLDFWPCATTMALVYDGKFFIIDFEQLEVSDHTREAEDQGKEVIRKILEANHLLKVVHDVDQNALDVLQRAVVLQDNLYDTSPPPPFPGITPMVDLAVVAAYTRRTRPMDQRCSRLAALCFDYLRYDLCVGESLSNFERRPLRRSQMHYMLTLAWCPLMILRTLCCFDIVSDWAARSLVMRIGPGKGWAEGWTTTMRQLNFAPADAAFVEGGDEAFAGIQGPCAKNVWEGDSEECVNFRQSLPRPALNLDLHQALQGAAALQYPTEAARPSLDALVARLFDKGATLSDLSALCAAYRQPPQ